MKSTSKITYMAKIREGMVFQEDFESDQFVSFNGWQVLAGIPTHTKAQAAKGTFSLLMKGTQDVNGWPIRLKANPPTNEVYDWVVTAWFYDDASETNPATAASPILKVKLTDGKYLQVGPVNFIDSAYYSCNDTASFADLSLAPTTVPRTTGWHRFMFVCDSSGSPSHYQIWIDGTLVQNLSRGLDTRAPVESIYLYSSIYEAAAEGFGYFDEVRYMRDRQVEIDGMSGRRIYIPGIGTTNHVMYDDIHLLTPAFNLADNDYELQISQQIVSNTNTEAYNYPAIYLPTGDPRRAMVGGDFFVIREVDFGRRATSFQNQPGTIGANSVTNSGSSETITTGRMDKVPLVVSSLEGFQWVQAAQNFYEYARFGSPFSFCLYSNECVFCRLAADMPAGFEWTSVTSTLGVLGSMIVPHRYYMLERADRSGREILYLDEIYGDLVHFATRSSMTFKAGDILRSIYFWPSMEHDVPRTQGFRITDARNVRYDWTIPMREHVF